MAEPCQQRAANVAIIKQRFADVETRLGVRARSWRARAPPELTYALACAAVARSAAASVLLTTAQRLLSVHRASVYLEEGVAACLVAAQTRAAREPLGEGRRVGGPEHVPQPIRWRGGTNYNPPTVRKSDRLMSLV
jgi:hypothetical protein